MVGYQLGALRSSGRAITEAELLEGLRLPEDWWPGTGAWEPPAGPGRVTGGLLGVLGAEGSTLARGARLMGAGPVGQALVDLANGFVASRGELPVEVARRHAGVDSPAWLLAVAVARPGVEDRLSDAVGLAAAAGFDEAAQAAAAAYVDVAGCLLASDPETVRQKVADTQRVVRELGLPEGLVPASSSSVLSPVGQPVGDALAVSLWALGQRDQLGQLVDVLADRVPAGVLAAVGGLVGLRDGADCLPGGWLPKLPGAGDVKAVVPALLRVRAFHHPVAVEVQR